MSTPSISTLITGSASRSSADTMYFHAQLSGDSRQRVDQSMGSNDAAAVNARRILMEKAIMYGWRPLERDRRCDHVCSPEIRWMVGRSETCFLWMRKTAFHNGTGSETIFSRLGFWRSSILLRSIRSAGERNGVCAAALPYIVSFGFADPFHQVFARND